MLLSVWATTLSACTASPQPWAPKKHSPLICPWAGLANEVVGAAHWVGAGIHVGPGAVRGDALVPRGELAGGIEAGPQIMSRDGGEAATVDVALARPHDFHRSPRLFRQQHGVDD